ncbi:hypothetical protein [Yoonia sp. MH D7]
MDGLLRTSAKSALCEFKSAEMLHPALMSAMRVAGAAFEYPRERQQWAGPRLGRAMGLANMLRSI